MAAILKPMNSTSARERLSSKLMPFGIVLALWGGLVLLFAIQTKTAMAIPWGAILTQIQSFWLPWVVFLPIVVLLSLQFPFEKPRIPSQAGVHLLACAIILTINYVISRFLLPPPPPMVGAHNSPPPEMRMGPDVVVYLLTMSACVAFAHFRKSQEGERRAVELEARLAQAKLQALRMQINPHFLFNTLNAISTLIHTNPAVADDMVTDLGELFRGSLESSDDQEIPLARELELLDRYLAIEQRRFGTRLEVERRIATEVLRGFVPTLILQPLVENAIRHGIQAVKSVGKIAIHGRREGERIVLSVSDNGTKPVDLSLLKSGSPRRGIGLRNTEARLRQLYGKQASLALGTGELGGWVVQIELPFKLAAGKSA
jgi:two-component sensor histidine kinase